MEEEEQPVNPMEQEVLHYLKEHKVMELFENLTAALIYSRPDDPKAFMRSYIQQLQKAKCSAEDEEPPSFINESNICSVFGMLDITRKGHITHQQYLQAMQSLGVSQFNRSPAGAELNRITQATFVRESKAAVKAAMSTFLDY